MTQNTHRTWVYHAQHKPRLVNVTSEQMAELKAEGWALSPGEAAGEDASPSASESTQNQKDPSDIDPPSDDQNGNPEGGNEPNPEASTSVADNDKERAELIARFQDNPEDLDKDELVKLGRYLGVKMMKAWKESTLINKVREGLE